MYSSGNSAGVARIQARPVRTTKLTPTIAPTIHIGLRLIGLCSAETAERFRQARRGRVSAPSSQLGSVRLYGQAVPTTICALGPALDATFVVSFGEVAWTQ